MTSLKELTQQVPNPQNLTVEINKILSNKNADQNVGNLFKEHSILVNTWNTDNKRLLNFYASIILNSFYLHYLNLLQEYFNKKYSIQKMDIDSEKLSDIVDEIKVKMNTTLDKKDLDWINNIVINTIDASLKTIDLYNLHINDLSVLAKISQNEINYLESNLKDMDIETSEIELKQSFLNYIDKLTYSKYLDKNKMEAYVQPYLNTWVFPHDSTSNKWLTVSLHTKENITRENSLQNSTFSLLEEATNETKI